MNDVFCPDDSAAAAPGEKRLGNALTHAFPNAGGPSDNLRRRVRLLAARHEERRTRRVLWRRRVRAGFALAAAGAVVILALIAAPKLPAAYALSRMAEAAENAKSAHAVIWRVEQNGSRTKMGEEWYQNNRWRKENSHDVQVYANGSLYTYEPAANVVKVRRQGDGPFAYNSSGFSIGAVARDYARRGWSDQLRYVGETNVDGRPAREVVIQDGNIGVRFVLFADPATNLPFRADVQRETGTGWTTERISEVRYNDPLPGHLFSANAFPRGARRLDAATDRETWHRKLARGIARRWIGGHSLVIRDLQVNARGDLFLLYTGDDFDQQVIIADGPNAKSVRVFPVSSLEVTDDQGTRYLRQDNFDPYVAGARPNLWSGYVFDGKPLKGAWWTPVEPGTETPWQPRQFTLTFVKNPRWPETRPRPQTMTFTFSVEHPASALVPEYMPHMAAGPSHDDDILGSEAAARATYHHEQGRGGETDDKRRHLEQALALYHQAMRVRDEGAAGRNDPTMVHSDTWLAIHEALRDLGRSDEARDALRHAQDQDVYHNLDKRIAEARRRLDAQNPN